LDDALRIASGSAHARFAQAEGRAAIEFHPQRGRALLRIDARLARDDGRCGIMARRELCHGLALRGIPLRLPERLTFHQWPCGPDRIHAGSPGGIPVHHCTAELQLDGRDERAWPGFHGDADDGSIGVGLYCGAHRGREVAFGSQRSLHLRSCFPYQPLQQIERHLLVVLPAHQVQTALQRPGQWLGRIHHDAKPHRGRPLRWCRLLGVARGHREEQDERSRQHHGGEKRSHARRHRISSS